ncbi:MAG: TrkH family potassium uptake protein, partial [Aestuariivirgaceae bacterium]
MQSLTNQLGAMLQKRRAPIIEFNRVSFVIGIMLLVLTVFMFPPAVTDIIASNPDWQVFAGSAFVTGFIGMMLVMMSRGRWSNEVSLKEGFLLTVLSWVVLATFAAMPFVFLGSGLSLIDAWFEAVSGLTTTGSTVMTGLDELPPGILLWRSIIQWIGGIGIVVMALIMLPFLKVGGMQLFQTENSDRTDKFLPRAREVMGLIAFTYLALTATCAVAYGFAGMNGFDALNHAMTTVATSGFSTHDASFGYFKEAAIHWVAFVFMFASSLPLVLYVKAVKTGSLRAFDDQQVRGFCKMVGFILIGLTLWLATRPEITLADALLTVCFNAMAIISTTGYSSGDYTAWGTGAAGAFFVLMFLGGCTGSTTGGMKTFRLQVMLLSAYNYIKQLMSPNRVVVSTYNGKQITADITTSVLAYLSVMFASVMMFTVALSFFDLDFITSLSGALTALANVGPALGPQIGPAGNFGGLPDGAKLILI